MREVSEGETEMTDKYITANSKYLVKNNRGKRQNYVFKNKDIL